MPVDDKIKVFDSDDKSLKILGELLSNDTSRKIIRMLIGKECYTNELATKLDIRVSLVIHHLKKLEELGLLDINHKQIVKKGNNHRYFKINAPFLIIPDKTKEELEEKGILKKIFRDGITFFGFGCALVISWFSGQVEQRIQSGNIEEEALDQPDPGILILLLIGLGIFFILKQVKRKKRLEV